jgi:opacity protein-like surface antigen
MKRTLLSIAVAGGLLASSGVMAGDRFAGLSVGAQLGYGQLETVHNDLDYWYYDYKNFRAADEGFSLGVKADYNVVNSGLLYGARLELSFTNLDSIVEAYPSNPSYEVGSDMSLLGSLSAKFGKASDDVAVYAFAGIAFADVDHSHRDTDGSNEGFKNSGDSTGIVFGVGAEFALDEKSSIGVDVGRYKFSSKKHEVIDAGVPQDYFYNLRDTVTDIKVSYNFKF